MARCYWARRGIFGLQIETLEGERETYRKEVNRRLATGCDRLGTGFVTVVRILKMSPTGVMRTQ